MIVTCISDTHSLHHKYNLTPHLPGGDLLIHAGDVSSMGTLEELINFSEWFVNLPYRNKVFIAGNHDFGLDPTQDVNHCEDIYNHYISDSKYVYVRYLQDTATHLMVNNLHVYGHPWTPGFGKWCFQHDRYSAHLKAKVNNIPYGLDLLVTHSPPYGKMDVTVRNNTHVGCELLAERISIVKPKLCVFGHIHEGHGYSFDGTTHFINASVLNERYEFVNKPLTFDWDVKENTIEFIES